MTVISISPPFQSQTLGLIFGRTVFPQSAQGWPFGISKSEQKQEKKERFWVREESGSSGRDDGDEGDEDKDCLAISQHKDQK